MDTRETQDNWTEWQHPSCGFILSFIRTKQNQTKNRSQRWLFKNLHELCHFATLHKICETSFFSFNFVNTIISTEKKTKSACSRFVSNDSLECAWVCSNAEWKEVRNKNKNRKKYVMKPRIITSYDNADWENRMTKVGPLWLIWLRCMQMLLFLLLARFFFAPLIRNIWSMFIMSIVILCFLYFSFHLFLKSQSNEKCQTERKKTLLLSFIVVVCLIWVFFAGEKRREMGEKEKPETMMVSIWFQPFQY